MKANDRHNWNRRTLLKLSGLGLVGGIAGCLEDSGGDSGGDAGGDSGGSSDGGSSDGGSSDGGSSDGGSSGGGDGDGGSDSGGSDGMDSYTIGMVDSLTGSLAPYGKRNDRGKALALEAVNEVGIGPDGAQLEIVVEDDESTNQGGVNAAQKLVNQDGVPLLIGSVGSGVSIAIHDSVTKASNVVQISQNSTSPKLTEKPELNRMSPSGTAKWKALAALLEEDGHDTVAATWINNDYGQGFADTFPEFFGGDVAFNEPHDQGQSSYSGLLTKMASTDATAWLLITYANEYTVMVNEGYDQGYNEMVDYYGAESTKATEILENTQPGSQNGMKGITESAPQDQENYKSYVESFQSAYDTEPTVWSAYAYDAVTVAALAIATAEEFTGPALKEVVREVTRPEGTKVYNFAEAMEVINDGGGPSDVNYEGVSGPVDLDENGDPPGYYQVYGVEDHEYTTVKYITS